MIAIVPRGGGLCAAGKSFEQFTQQKVENKMNQHNRAARLCRLFFSTLYISSFTFGGGFVIVTLMKKKFVDELHWITEEEMLDMTALAESAPGAIAVNAAILVGWQMEGLPGMMTAVVGTILPPMVILSIISYFYNVFAANVYVALVLKGMQAGVAAVILDVVCSMGGKVIASHSAVSLFLMVAAFAANYIFGVNVVLIILAAAVFGLCALRWPAKGRCEDDLLTVISQLFAGGAVQRGRRLRCHAADPQPGCGAAPLDDLAGIHQSDYHCRNDARPDCGQLRHLCGAAHCPAAGSGDRHAGVHYPRAGAGLAAGVVLPALAGSFGFAERAGLSATGGDCLDSGGRAFDFGDRGVPQRNLGAGQH